MSINSIRFNIWFHTVKELENNYSAAGCNLHLSRVHTLQQEGKEYLQSKITDTALIALQKGMETLTILETDLEAKLRAKAINAKNEQISSFTQIIDKLEKIPPVSSSYLSYIKKKIETLKKDNIYLEEIDLVDLNNLLTRLQALEEKTDPSDVDISLEMPSEPSSFSLPDEVALYCFSYLDIQNLAHCSRVSKLFYRLAGDRALWAPHWQSLFGVAPSENENAKTLYRNLMKGSFSFTILEGHSATTSFVKFGSTLITASLDKTIKLWDLNTKTCSGTLVGHQSEITRLAIHDTTLISASCGGEIMLWDLNTHTCIGTIKHDQTNFYEIFISDNTLISQDSESNIMFWDLNTKEWIATLEEQKKYIKQLSVNDKTLIVADVGEKGIIKLWDISNPKEYKHITTFKEHKEIIKQFAIKDTLLIVHYGDDVIKILDLKQKKCIATSNIAQLGTVENIVIPGYDPIRLWDLNTTGAVMSGRILVLKAPDNNNDEIFHIWDLEQNKLFQSLKLPGSQDLYGDTLLINGTKLIYFDSNHDYNDYTIKILDFSKSK